MAKYYLFLFVFAFAALQKVQAQKVTIVTLKQLNNRLDKGKDTTFVINFWATWCAPCIEELPNFEKLGRNKENLPFKVLLASMDFKSQLQSGVIPFIKKNAIRNDVFLMDIEDQQSFINAVDTSWSGSIPATLIVSKSKQVHSFFERTFTYNQLEQTIDSLKLN